MLCRSLLALSLLALLSACSVQSPEQQVRDHVTAILSWTASAHMAADAWQHDRVPDAYIEQQLQMAQEELQAESEELSKPELKQQFKGADEFAGHLQRVQQALGDLNGVVQRGDKQAAGPIVAALAGEYDAMNKLAEQAGLAS